MLKRTTLAKSLLIAFGAGALHGSDAVAQQAPAVAPQELQRVEVTGSAIKRLDAETALPVTVLKFDEPKKEGIVTIEQVLSMIGGNQSQQGTSQSVGLSTGGASFASLRGLGQNKTLVLLNGRRIANNSFDGSAPDLNMIPFAQLERVEVLRDGASALYGSDAIDSVITFITFITKKDLTGGTITLGADMPRQDGGKSQNANVDFGFGDLTKNRYNVMGFIDFQKQDPILASQRPFGSSGVQEFGHRTFARNTKVIWDARSGELRARRQLCQPKRARLQSLSDSAVVINAATTTPARSILFLTRNARPGC